MVFIGIIIALFVFITSLILPWINRSNIAELRNKVERLQTEIARLKNVGMVSASTEVPNAGSSMPPHVEAKPIDFAASTPEAFLEPVSPYDESESVVARAVPHQAPKERRDESPSFEQRFGGQAFVWLGGIALALAGFFMVKYSIETGLLSPTVRIVLGMIFGAALLGCGAWVREQPRFANGTRIAQALSGAGIGDLYATIFAATSLYHLVPSFVGLCGLAAVTAGAVILSLRHGVPIALLGLVGGFLTPALVGSSSPSAPLLFLYLYFVLTGFMVVIRKQGWWFMAIPTVLAAFLWISIWLFGGHFGPNDTLWLGLFLAAISITVIGASKEAYTGEALRVTDSPVCLLNYITLGGAAVLMGVTAAKGGFGVMEWGLFGLISLGGIGLAFFNQKLYGIAPWASLAVNAVMLMAWPYGEAQHFAITLAWFAALYIASGYGLQSRSANPLSWAGLTMAASLGYYLMGYFKLHDSTLFEGLPLFWGTLALAFAVGNLYAMRTMMRDVPKEHPQKQHLLALYAALITAFLSIALTIELEREFLSVAFAGEILAIAWINTRVDIRALRFIVMILAGVFGFLLLPEVQDYRPIVNAPFFHLGLPALFFLGSAYWLRQQKDDDLVRSLEIIAIALLGFMGYYVVRHAFHVDGDILFAEAGFIERSVISNMLFAYGIACLAAGRIYRRTAVSLSGLVLSGLALARIGYFDFIAYNPLWSEQAVGTWPILNWLLLAYGLPILWVGLANRELPLLNKSGWCRYFNGATLLLAFTLVSLNVRQFFHGPYLNGHTTSSPEIYTYSAAWLLFGIGLLFVGTLRSNALIRIASLPILLLTIGKVFLYDASELTGLWRVFSFFGLGLSLLALSWFYSRFVFGKRDLPEVSRK